MHRGYELSSLLLTTNPTRITEFELISAGRESVRSDLQEGELFDAGFDAPWEINLFGTHRNSTETAGAVYGTSAYALRAIQVSVEGETARN
jgi:outer membrane protein TolC